VDGGQRLAKRISILKILLLDIETSPNIGHIWGLWNQNIGLNQLMESSHTICWAAKWLGEGEPIHFQSEHHSDFSTMIHEIHALVDEADVVIHYNGTRFDMPTLNKEFLSLGMAPPAPYRQIDLLPTAKKKFRFPSNKLQYVADFMGLGSKVKHEGHTLWVKCMAGDPVAWENMKEYNIEDVHLLERVYNGLLPWLHNAPSLSVYADVQENPMCPRCNGAVSRSGFAHTALSKFQRYQCKECGGWSRGRKNVLDSTGHLLSNVAGC
jgi:DNA polymerase elongation subunit (family B)